jgi:hypothetical protein
MQPWYVVCLWWYVAAAGAPPSRSAETCALWLLCFVALGLRIGSDEPSQHERAQAPLQRNVIGWYPGVLTWLTSREYALAVSP